MDFGADGNSPTDRDATTSRRERNGFTLVELLIVLVVLAILMAMATVRANSPKEKAAVATMQQDLQRIASAQEAHFSANQAYTSVLSDLDAQLSEGVSIQINADADGWTAQTSHDLAGDRKCALMMGDISPLAPAERSGRLACGQTSGGGPGCGG